jgi:type VI secretion system secreted protein VgrG
VGCDKSEKGVFISADAQEKAQGQALMMDEALSQLQEALSLVEALHSAAEVAKSELADLQTQKTLLSETLTELKKSALLLLPRDCTGYAQKPAIILRGKPD